MLSSLLCINRHCLRVSSTSATTFSPKLVLLHSGASVHARGTALSALRVLARMSKKSIPSSSSSSSRPSGSTIVARSSKKNEAQLPTERQKTLNRFLGLPLEQRQTRVDSLFRKQATSSTTVAAAARSFTSSTGTASEARQVMEIDGSSDVEEVNTISKTNGKKRRVVASSDEESDDASVTVSAKTAPAPSSSKTTDKDEKEIVEAAKPVNGSVEKPNSKEKPKDTTNVDGHVDKKPKKEEGSSKTKPAPKIASIFAAPSKKASTSTSKTESSIKVDKKKVDKGKAKADDTEDIESTSSAAKVVKEKTTSAANSDEGGEISGVDENGNEEADDSALESEEEQEQAAKLAEIFTKKVAGSSKGKYGKGIDWKTGDPVPYAALAEVFERIDSTTKRLEIAAYLTTFLTSVIERTPGDLIKVIYLCINRIAPDYEGLELGIGEGMLKKAIAQATGVNVAHINAEYKKAGDLGLVAMNSRATQATLFKPKPLTVNHVFNKLREIAKTSGASSQTKKVGSINGLLAACQGQEAKFIIRSCEGKLRIGLAEQTVLGSLAHATVYARHARDSKKTVSSEKLVKELEDASKTLKTVFSECPNYDLVIPPLLEGGTDLLREKIRITPGIPLKPMLAKPTKAISEVLDRFEGKKFTCEYKYDGERAQVHYSSGKLSVFSRNSEDMSVKYPDLIEHMQKCIKPNTESFVLDAEAVAWDKDENKILPFQELSKRKRKDVKAEDIKVKVHIFAFDLLYLNGESLLKKDLEHRRILLREHFTPVEGQFAFAKSRDIYAVEEIQAFLDESIKDSCEGLMVKMMEGEDATYEPSRRSMNWLKLKKDYLAGVGDSFDLVVIGGYHGRGKRTSVYGAFLLACYDPESETYQAITKIGTGFSEEVLESHYQFLKPLELTQKKPYFDLGDSKPDVFFEPKVVWEVLAADLSLSPVYSAAKGIIEARGISLRFPRFIRIRDDKDPDDASNSEFVAEAYQRQVAASGGGGKGKKKGGGDDGGGGDGFW